MSTVSQGNPARAMKRAAAMLPSESQVPICGFPACNARLTGFSFTFRSSPTLFEPETAPRRNPREQTSLARRARRSKRFDGLCSFIASSFIISRLAFDLSPLSGRLSREKTVG